MSSTSWTFPSGLRHPRRAAARRVRRWAQQRQGPDPLTTRLRPGRVYILPTGIGLVYALMTFAMLLGSMNYNNNLSFLLTFLLVGVGFIAMHQCQRNLVGVELSFAGAEPVFAGRQARFRIAATNRSKARRQRLWMSSDDGRSEILDLGPGESRTFAIPLSTTQRGRLRLERFAVRTLFPFELFRAWAWLHMEIDVLVYPRPADDAPPPPISTAALGHRQHDARGEEDFAGLRRFHVGDSPRNVAWKAYARSEQLLAKQFSGADTSSQWFDFERVPAGDVEKRLSILTRWIIDADRIGADYGLTLPGRRFEPAHGDAHRHRCLEALALFGRLDDRQERQR